MRSTRAGGVPGCCARQMMQGPGLLQCGISRHLRSSLYRLLGKMCPFAGYHAERAGPAGLHYRERNTFLSNTLSELNRPHTRRSLFFVLNERGVAFSEASEAVERLQCWRQPTSISRADELRCQFRRCRRHSAGDAPTIFRKTVVKWL